MDKGTKALLNIVLSILAPVLILEHCSTGGNNWWELGTTWAMVVALSLPISCGFISYISEHRLEPLTLVGMLGTILTGIVTLYANMGDSETLQPDTPWWYGAKEALIPLILAGSVIATAKSKNSLLRAFVYSDTLFNISSIEKKVAELGKESTYDRLLKQVNYALAASLIFSAVANAALALYFLLPVLDTPAANQAEQYNYAVGKMTWWGYIVIGIPLMGTLLLVIRHLGKKLQDITLLPERDIYMK